MRPKMINRDDLYRLYITKQQGMYDIARLYNCSAITIRNYLLKHNIPIRKKSDAQKIRNLDSTKHVRGKPGEENGNYRHGAYIQERIYRTMIEISTCNRCGNKSSLVVHHKNGDHYDNHPENLEVLCRSCHMSHHKTEYWKSRAMS